MTSVKKGSMSTAAALRGLARTLVVEPGVAPACALAVASRRRGTFRVNTGAAGVAAPSRSTTAGDDTLFDLASVTKPIVALTFARLWGADVLSPRTRLDEVLPEARDTPSASTPLGLLLSHRAGLEAHLDLFEPLTRARQVDRSEALRAAAAGRRPECSGEPPDEGFAPRYSDLGYLLLGAALEGATSRPLDELVDHWVSQPLRLEITSAARWRERAPARLAAAAETETASFRGGPVVGAVHDENAWAVGGLGTCGHAGLFGTAEAVARLGVVLLDVLAGRRAGFLSRGALGWLLRPRPGGTLLGGFDAKSPHGSSAGNRLGPSTFGHLGFTGTSLWCDPAAEVVCAILTNRVCPTRANVAIRRVRPRLNDALFELSQRPGHG